MRRVVCDGCKFAKWQMTKNGRLSPTGWGECTWEKTFVLAASCSKLENASFKGGLIRRRIGSERPALGAKCGVYQRAD